MGLLGLVILPRMYPVDILECASYRARYEYCQSHESV